jgi:hypothetical protein
LEVVKEAALTGISLKFRYSLKNKNPAGQLKQRERGHADV